jgi:hypothetical protein
MSKGIWTKHLVAVEGVEGGSRAFYYNAAHNRSQWFPPKDGLVTEAVNLSLASTTPDAGQSDSNSNNDLPSQQLSPEDVAADEFIAQLLSGDQAPPQPQQQQYSSAATNTSIEERIQQAINNNKEKVLSQSTGNKRFKSQQISQHEHEGLSDYERQKIELEAMAGSRGENAGKWLVR